MPRNGGGNYSLPEPPFVPNTPISSSAVNSDLSDMATALTGSVASDGQTTITGPIKFANGTVGSPSITFASDTNTGVYRVSADVIGVAAGGSLVSQFNSTGIVSGIAGIDLHGASQVTAPAVDDELFIYDLSGTSNARMTFSDYLKVINQLTVDGSPDAAADYLVTYDASASGPKKVLLQSLPPSLPRGYIDGCTLSNDVSDATNDLDIAAGACRDYTNTADLSVPVLVKQLDANWAAGTNQGMRYSGAGIANTTYHIYAARTAASATADIYADPSASEATALGHLQAETGGSSYVYIRRIGSILRESDAIVGFVQSGNLFDRKTLGSDVSATDPGTSAVSRTLLVPVGVNVVAHLISNITSNEPSSTYGLLTPLDCSDEAPSSTRSQFGNAAASLIQAASVSVRTNTSAQIRSRISFSGSTVVLTIRTRGWTDLRGGNA